MAQITNTEVFGLATSIYRSRYPMMDHAPTEKEFYDATTSIANMIDTYRHYDNVDIEAIPHIKRSIKLAHAKGGGHDQFLTGIIVNFDMTFSNKAWVEANRYTFLNYISSMSCMHRASIFPIADMCNESVSAVIDEEVTRLQKRYNEIDGDAFPDEKKAAYLTLLYNIPAGFELTAAMTTNYRCLKNIYAQRRNHRLPDWHVFCDWVETLPLAKLLICG